MAALSSYVEVQHSRRFMAMRERSLAFFRLREAQKRFDENRYAPRRPELWAEVEYWRWRLGRRAP